MGPVLRNQTKKQTKKICTKIKQEEVFIDLENKGHKNIVQTETSEINRLSDNCLIEIFGYLSISERIRIERTCKKWLDLSKLSWSNFNNFNLSSLLKHNRNLFKKNKTNLDINQMLYKIISKCGKYLHFVNLEVGNCDEDINFSSLIYYLAIYCNNIEDLIITGNNLNEYDIHFGFLFSKNKGLKSVRIKGAELNGNCFLSLSHDTLEKLIFEDVNISSTLPELTLNLKKLTTLELRNRKPDIEVDNLLTISLIAPNFTYLKMFNPKLELSFNYLKLASEMKSLKILKLGKVEVNRNFLLNLPNENLEKLILLYGTQISPDSLIFCLMHFKRLSGFGFCNINISESLAECFKFNRNLKYFRFKISNSSSISAAAINKIFTNFSKLEILDLSFSFIDDHFLAIISLHCKSITAINLCNCKSITDTGLIFITSLPELEILSIHNLENVSDSALKLMPNIKELNCFNCNKIGSEGLCNLLKTSPKLERLDISSCNNIKYEDIFDTAIESINIRGKKNILNIFIHCRESRFQNYIKKTSNFPNLKLLRQCMKQNNIFY